MNNIQSAQYMHNLDGENVAIKITFTDTSMVKNVPLSLGNADYAEIMRQVDEGTLTIQDADD